MAIIISVKPGRILQAGEKVTNAKLNQMAQPVLNVQGAFGPTDMTGADYSGVLAAGPYFYAGLDTGTVNAYAATITPTIAGYEDGLIIAFKASTGNTGPATLNVNGLGPQPILKNATVPLSAGDIVVDQIVEVRYQLDANIVPAGATYSGAGSYTLTVTPGRVYTWSKNANDTQLVNGSQTLGATGSFTAAGSTVTLNGTASVAVTATVIPSSNVWQMESQLGSPFPPVPILQPASKFVAGTQGLAPAPAAGQQNLFLRGDSTWQDAVGQAAALANQQSQFLELFKYQNFN